MKRILTTILLLAASTGSLFASAIQFATGGGRGHMFVMSPPTDNVRVPALSLVRVGYVTTPGNLSTFVEFASTTISNPSPTFPVGGFLTSPAASTTIAPAAKGAQIYLWVYNAPTAGASTQAGIFTSTDPSWVIPASFTGDPTETSNLTLNLVSGVQAIADPRFTGPTITQPSFSRGDILVGTTSAVGSIYKLGGGVIPEPTSIGLLALAGLAAARRRR